MRHRRHRRYSGNPLFSAFLLLLAIAVGMGWTARLQNLLLAGALLVMLLLLLGVAFLGIRHLGRRAAPVDADQSVDDDRVRVIPLDAAGIDRALREGVGASRSHRSSPPRFADPPASAPRTPTLVERLHAIDWFQFEKLMEMAFRKHGYRVERRGGAHADDGIDLVVEREGLVTAVQCKHWKAWKVNPKTVRELLGAMTGGRVPHGMILTLKGYTADAHAKAREYGIVLWGEAEILQMLRGVDAEFDPDMLRLLDDRQKYCPRCESEMVLRTATRGPSAGGQFWGCSRYPACKYTLAENENDLVTSE